MARVFQTNAWTIEASTSEVQAIRAALAYTRDMSAQGAVPIAPVLPPGERDTIVSLLEDTAAVGTLPV